MAFNTTPSTILGVDESEVYLCYCINEACAYIYNKMQPDKDGKTVEPRFKNIQQNKSQNPGLDLLLGL